MLIQPNVRQTISQHHSIGRISATRILALYFDWTGQLSTISPIADRSDAAIRDDEYTPVILLEPIAIYQG